MGNSASSNEVNVLNESINKLSSSNVQQCVTNSTQVQAASQSAFGINIGVKQKILQNTTIKQECIMDVSRTNALVSQITSQLQQYAESNLGSMTVGQADSSNAANIKSKVSNALSVSNINNNFNSIMQTQLADQKLGGINIFASQEAIQGAEVYAGAVLKSLEDNNVVTDIVNDVRQKSVSTTEGILDGIMANLTYIIMAVVIIILAILYVVMKNPQLVIQVMSAIGFEASARSAAVNAPQGSTVQQTYGPEGRSYTVTTPEQQQYEQPQPQTGEPSNEYYAPESEIQQVVPNQ